MPQREPTTIRPFGRYHTAAARTRAHRPDGSHVAAHLPVAHPTSPSTAHPPAHSAARRIQRAALARARVRRAYLLGRALCAEERARVACVALTDAYWPPSPRLLAYDAVARRKRLLTLAAYAVPDD